MINISVAAILNASVYTELENHLYDQYSLLLVEAKKRMQREFQHSDDEQWQNIAIELADEFDTDCLILARTTENFEQDTLAAIALPQHEAGYIALEMGAVYLPLTDEFVVELGPVPYQGFWYFVAQWFSWGVAISLNFLLILLYIRNQHKQQLKVQQAVDDLPIELSPLNVDLVQRLEEVALALETSKQENKDRLNLQRDLLHGVAHEFRSPLARLQFALDMLEQAPEPERENLLASLNGSLSALDELVRELLYYAKLKDINASLDFKEVDLKQLASAAVEQVASFYPNVHFSNSIKYLDKQSIDSNISQGIAKLDENLISRLVINLLRNAGRFAQEKCALTITINTNNVILSVEDDGVGIPPGKSERIFEPFTRLDPSRSRDSGGCGLGLAIVASIAKLHHGNVSVEASELGGAGFVVTLPLI